MLVCPTAHIKIYSSGTTGHPNYSGIHIVATCDDLELVSSCHKANQRIKGPSQVYFFIQSPLPSLVYGQAHGFFDNRL